VQVRAFLRERRGKNAPLAFFERRANVLYAWQQFQKMPDVGGLQLGLWVLQIALQTRGVDIALV